MITGLSIKSKTYISNKEAALPIQYVDQYTKKAKCFKLYSVQMPKKMFYMQFVLRHFN